jgi:hypothetical protein
MKMDDLANLLTKKTSEVQHNKPVVERVKMAMFDKYGVLRGETHKIFSGEIEFKKMEKNTLIRFMLELNEEIKEMNLNPYGYFTEREINFAKIQDSNKKENEKFPIRLINTNKINEDTYIAFVNAKDIVNLYNYNLLSYNYMVSSNYKFIKNKAGNLVKSIDIDNKLVKRISEQILIGKYPFKKIILNILMGSSTTKDYGKEITYSENNKELLIHQSQVDIISGLHDINALMIALGEFQDLQIKIEVEIKHLPLDEIQQYFNKLSVKGEVN